MSRKQIIHFVPEVKSVEETKVEQVPVTVDHDDIHRAQMNEVCLTLRESIKVVERFGKDLRRMSNIADNVVSLRADLDCSEVGDFSDLVQDIVETVIAPIYALEEDLEATVDEFKDACRQAIKR